MKYTRISYDISSKTTANAAPYNKNAVKVTAVESFEKGNDSLSSMVEFFNHCGTHIDMPAHKIRNGKSLVQASIDEFIFENPLLIDIPLIDEQNVSKEDLKSYGEQLKSCDILMIRSGFSRYRNSDLKRYIWNTPGVSVEAAEYIISVASNLKAIGIDFLSFETLLDTSHDSRAHKLVLEHDIKIIEDMTLEGLRANKIERIFAMPLFVEGVDSFHATVVAELSC